MHINYVMIEFLDEEVDVLNMHGKTKYPWNPHQVYY